MKSSCGTQKSHVEHKMRFSLLQMCLNCCRTQAFANISVNAVKHY